MINYLSRIVLLIAIMVFNFQHSRGQSKIDTVVLKKGEVLDILLLSQNAGVDSELKSYFQTAFPVAKRMSYQPIPGFRIMNYTQGNIGPSTLILGKWNNLKLREDFLSQIVKEVPDFHERRRVIWSFFGLRYFEIKQDVTLKINHEKFHVATAYWMESEKESNKFYKKWKSSIQEMGGETLIQLTDGKSPFGYQYNPDFFVLTSWENEDAFKAFQKSVQTLEMDGIQHVNEFILK